MGMLHAALAQQERPGRPRKQQLCTIYYSLSIEECTRNDFREQYDLQPWDSFGLTKPKPEPEVLDSYAKDIQELCRITRLHQVQVSFVVQHRLAICQFAHCTIMQKEQVAKCG